VLPVLLSSSTPATVSPISPRIVVHFRVDCENSTGFDIFNITVRFVSCFRAFCVVVEFHSSHSFANFSVLTPHFRRFRENSTDAVLLLSSTPATVFAIFSGVVVFVSSFASCVQCCVVVEFHSSHSPTYAYSRPHTFSFAGWRKPPRPFRLRSLPP
jgi:hypothetical protein